MARHKDPRFFFYKKTFYLDLKHFRGEVDLIKDIKRFGGKVESFLSKDVNYVISDRPEAKPKIEPSYPETPSSLAPLMSPTELYKSPYGFMLSPAPSSPFNERGKGTVTSRGLALVQKAKQKSEGTGDVLGICNQWKIKVFYIQVITFFINKLKNLYWKKEHEHKENYVCSELPQSPRLKLSVPFIKVEDVKLRYRSHYKELRPADVIFKSDLGRAVRKVHEDFYHGDLNPENQDSSVLKERNSPCRDQPSPITVNFTPVIHKNFSTPSVFKKQFGSKMGLLNDSKENRIESKGNLRNKANVKKLPSPKRKKDHKGSSNFTKLEKKQEKQKYCEICQEQYADLETHISSSRHQMYVSDTIYFGDLREIISKLPSLDSFMKKVAKQRQERELQQSEFASHKSHTECPLGKYENYHDVTVPHSGRIPLLNCEEKFSDSTKGIQPEPGRVENGNGIPADQGNGVAHPFDAGVNDGLENKENCAVVLRDQVKPKSPAHHDNLNNGVYDAVTEEYVSASCSTDDSNMLAYLEDSADNLVGPCTQNVSPAILLKESPILETNRPLQLTAFHSPCVDSLGYVMDLTSRTKSLNCNGVALCSFQMETVVKNENGDHSSSAALDLTLPPPLLSPIFTYGSSVKRKPYSFSMSKAKRIKFDTGVNGTDASVVKCDESGQDEIAQNVNENCSVCSCVPNMLSYGITDVNAELPNVDENHKRSIYMDGNSWDCAPLLSPIGPVQSCSGMRALDRDEEATHGGKNHCGNELDVCPNQNVANELESQQCMKPFSLACTAEPPVEECMNETKELEIVTPSLSHSCVMGKLPPKGVAIAVESCNTVGSDETASNGVSNAESVVEVTEEYNPQNSVGISSANSKENSSVVQEKCNTESALTFAPIHGDGNTLNNEADNADVPMLQCCVSDKNGQLEFIAVAMPVLEPNAVQTSYLEAGLQLQEAAVKQNSCLSNLAVPVEADSLCSSPDKVMALGCVREQSPDLNECFDKPVCLKNVGHGGDDEHQNEPEFLSFKDNVVNASVLLCPPDFQTDVKDCICDQSEKTAICNCEEVGKRPQLGMTFLPQCSSDSLDSQKGVSGCKYLDCSTAIPSDWKTDFKFKASGLPTQISDTLNSIVNPSSGGGESESADVSKWVSECDISSESEPEWENLKSNVDSLCQELEKLNSEPDIVVELPLNLALI